MTNKVKCIPKREYTFDEVGEFIFQKAFENSKGVGINIMLINKMMDIFTAEWDEDTDKYKLQIIEGSLALNFIGEELRGMYKIIPLFNL